MKFYTLDEMKWMSTSEMEAYIQVVYEECNMRGIPTFDVPDNDILLSDVLDLQHQIQLAQVNENIEKAGKRFIEASL